MWCDPCGTKPAQIPLTHLFLPQRGPGVHLQSDAPIKEQLSTLCFLHSSSSPRDGPKEQEHLLKTIISQPKMPQGTKQAAAQALRETVAELRLLTQPCLMLFSSPSFPEHHCSRLGSSHIPFDPLPMAQALQPPPDTPRKAIRARNAVHGIQALWKHKSSWLPFISEAW